MKPPKFKPDFQSWFYRNCVRQRRNHAKICEQCPFRDWIEKQEQRIVRGET